MALTIGTGPFSEHAAGRFDVAQPQTPLLFWESFAKRVRVVVEGETVADTRSAIALHETGAMMRLCLPVRDVRIAALTRGDDAPDARLGTLRRWCSGGEDAAVVASQIVSAPAAASALEDHVFFDLDAVDAWYLEDERGYAHPRNPYHRVDVLRSSRHVVVAVGDTVIAETWAPAILFETGIAPCFYMPADAIRPGVLARSETISHCPYKGDGQHWHVAVDGQRIEDACWNLTTPIGDALTIPRWFSFYVGKVAVTVDGERQKPT